MAKGKVLTIQRTVYLTKEMCAHLDQLASRRGQGCKVNDLIREALRLFLDEQVDVMTSRRHFQKSFQTRIDDLQTDILSINQAVLFYLHVLIRLLAFSLALLISTVTKTQVSPQQLIQRAIIEARKDESTLAEQIQTVRDMTVEHQP